MKVSNSLKRWRRLLIAPATLLVLVTLATFVSNAAAESPAKAYGQAMNNKSDKAANKYKVPLFAEQELLVKFRASVREEKKNKLHKMIGADKLREYKSLRLQRVKLRDGVSIEEAIAEYQSDQDIEYAEPNFTVTVNKTPNDPIFYDQWGLWNISTISAWDYTTGSQNVVVAIIDSGIDYNHEDLAANIWVNPGEIAGNGLDDDNNGYVDDVHGINAIAGSGNPMDDFDHGTHVAGIVGAKGNNGIGATGVNWKVSMIGCKFISNLGYGYTADAIECLEYLKELKLREQNPVNVTVSNNSWGSTDYSQALYDAIAGQPDILFIAAAGNDESDNDVAGHYPSNFPLPNILSVAALDDNGTFAASYSNFGKRSVDIAAPGTWVFSTLPNNNYGMFSGTSMAAPHVAGTAALLVANGNTVKQARNLILSSGISKTDLVDRTLTGKRLNAWKAMTCSNSTLLKPLDLPESITPGVPVTLSVISINCDEPWGPVSATLNGSEVIQLLDDGVGPDMFENDGVFTGSWIPPSDAVHSVEFDSPAGFYPVAIPVLKMLSPTTYSPAVSIGESTVSTATNIPFRQDFIASGGLAPLTWSLEGDYIPTLNIDSSSGEITGTPTSPGIYSYAVRVSDAAGTSAVRSNQSLIINDGIRPDQPITLPGFDEDAFLQSSPVFADLDGDGKDEIVVVTVSVTDTKSSLYVYDEYGLVARRDFMGYVSSPAIADLDGDGLLEIVVNVGWWQTSAPPTYALNKDLTTRPGFPVTGNVGTITDRCGYQQSPVISDLTNDGKLSIISICSPNYTYDPYYNKEIITVVDAQGQTLAGWPKAVGGYDDRLDNLVAVGDLDGDGWNEIVFFSADGVLHVYDKQGTELAHWTVFSGSGFASRPVLADFTGDGQLEIAVNYIQSQSKVAIYDRSGNLLPGWPLSYYSAASTGLMAADINSDGQADLVFTSGTSGSFDRYLEVLRYNGTPLAGWPVYTESLIQGFSKAAIGDVNGDGDQEVVVIDINNFRLYGFDRHGNQLSGYPKYFPPGPYGSYLRAAYPALGDIDGNNKVDIAVKTDGNMLYVWESPQTYVSPLLEWSMFGRDPQHSNTTSNIMLASGQARLLFPGPMTFPSIGAAYNALSGDDTIQVQFSNFTEDIVFDRALSVFLRGGFNEDFSVSSGLTNIIGSLTVRNGTLTVEKIRIK